MLNLKSIIIPSVSTLIMAGVLMGMNFFLLENIPTIPKLIIIILTGASIYSLITIYLARKYLGHFFLSLSGSLPPRIAKLASYIFISKQGV
jgi:hypothetical protein